MSHGSVCRAVWLACLWLPACGYDPKEPDNTRLDAGATHVDSAAGGVAQDARAAQDGATGPEVRTPDARRPSPDTRPAPNDAALDTSTVRLDARVSLDVRQTVDLPVILDVPRIVPDTAPPPSDAPQTCNAPPAPPQWAVLDHVDGNTAVGSVATYTCQEGYRPTNDGSAAVTKTCGADGLWKGPTIECGLVNCGTPPTVENAHQPEYTETTVNSKAAYSCKDYYDLAGSSELTCGKNGSWGYPPVCNPIRYTLYIAILGGSDEDTGNTVTDATADISCRHACDVLVQAGTKITLTAAAAPSWTFIEWSGGTCSGSEKCTFTMTDDIRVVAKFTQPPNIMFVTSTKQSANLGGLAGADALCNQRAKAVNPPLRGTYKAWLSTPMVSAISRIGTASGWVRPDGLPVFNRPTDPEAFYPPRLDESGADQGHVTVMTATTSSGTFMNTDNSTSCTDFTSTANPEGTYVLGGFASASGFAFTETSSSSCQEEQRIYCMGVDNTATLVPPKPVPGRYAFTTKQTWIPGGGIASADALCQSEASEAALPGTYKALLATDGYSAASRFATTSDRLPWIRTDGIRLSATAAGFFTTTLLDLPPNRSADGTRQIGEFMAWNGASTMTTEGTPTTTCLNWTSNQSPNSGSTGDLSVTGVAGFFGSSVAPCNDSFFLLCLQE